MNGFLFKAIRSGTDECCMTGKETEGLYVQTEAGGELFVSYKAINRFVGMKETEQNGKANGKTSPLLDGVSSQ